MDSAIVAERILVLVVEQPLAANDDRSIATTPINAKPW